ncbi:MAG: hypothetical protein IJ808_01340 [Muribaculaceae bacterium]|nr:hypothetical protein [Muribaculaceae bacterium]
MAAKSRNRTLGRFHETICPIRRPGIGTAHAHTATMSSEGGHEFMWKKLIIS